VQLLGAEKSLFRHMKGKGKAPKYGVLFGHEYVQKAPPERKGKVARLVSAKISLAAKTDFFTAEDKSEQLKRNLEEQVKKLV
jgi:nucleolar protein 56